MIAIGHMATHGQHRGCAGLVRSSGAELSEVATYLGGEPRNV
jgi:hypothetical protein